MTPTPTLTLSSFDEAILEARHVTKTHGGAASPVLIDASLTIHRGELVCIIGASGSGKSTLLALLGGLDHPTDGEISFEGTSFAGRSDRWMARFRRERAAFIFQSHNLLPTLTVRENVMLPLELGGIRSSVARERADEALMRVGLEHKFESPVTKLSGGESQRVAIARALAQRTELLLADEPTASLDSTNGRRVLDLVGARTEERTVVIVTHDLAVAKTADRVFFVRDGRVEEDHQSTRTEESGVTLIARAVSNNRDATNLTTESVSRCA